MSGTGGGRLPGRPPGFPSRNEPGERAQPNRLPDSPRPPPGKARNERAQQALKARLFLDANLPLLQTVKGKVQGNSWRPGAFRLWLHALYDVTIRRPR